MSTNRMEDLLERAKDFTPTYHREKSVMATAISGRLLEEAVELHLESGGTPISASSHVMDAITNEAFKKLKIFGNNQEAYPSNHKSEYNWDAVVDEQADVLLILLVSVAVVGVNIKEVLDRVELKIDKINKAKEEDKLVTTEKGLFYIKKD